MKLLLILFAFCASVALANKTVHAVPEKLPECKADRDAGAGPPSL